MKDAKGHLTYGYGLLMHPTGKYMDTIKKVWTQQDADRLPDGKYLNEGKLVIIKNGKEYDASGVVR